MATLHAATMLAKSLPDTILDEARELWGNTNVTVIKHWRDGVLNGAEDGDVADTPGMNAIAREKAERAVALTCSAYQPSGHGNAYERKHGENAVCATCNQHQWRHWLKQLLGSQR